MHIIFFSNYFPPEVNAPASRTFEHCKHWVKSENSVTVITAVPNFPDGFVYKGYKNRLFQWQEVEGVRVLRIWTFIAANRGFLKRSLCYISFIISSILGIILVRGGDMVISTSPQLFCALAGYIFSRFKRLPFILEVRDLWPASIIAVGAIKNRSLIKLLERLELFIYRRAFKIVVVSDAFKTIISKRGIPEDKIEVIKNGVDPEFFKPEVNGDELKNSLGLNGKFIVSYIGTIGMAQKLSQVLRLARLLYTQKDITFLLVGSGAEKESLIREKEKRLLSNVIFIDKQPREQIPLFYAISDVCLVTLKDSLVFKTTIPSKIFEIMAMGKPILLGVDGEARELVVEKAQAGVYYKPEDTDDLERKFSTLYRDKALRERLGANGRVFVGEKFNRRDLALKYLEILKTK